MLTGRQWFSLFCVVSGVLALAAAYEVGAGGSGEGIEGIDTLQGAVLLASGLGGAVWGFFLACQWWRQVATILSQPPPVTF
jgi:hypothetical protein